MTTRFTGTSWTSSSTDARCCSSSPTSTPSPHSPPTSHPRSSPHRSAASSWRRTHRCPDGRYVIYGCPECEDLACGAVTAVIERDGQEGEDYIWRDFAWQTAEHADPELNGYHGIGPFRFRGAEYREALSALLDGRSRGTRRRVLLIGARVALLAKLAAALRTIGIGADIAHDVNGVHADELRGYGAVAFGRAVTQEERAAVRRSFEQAGVEVAYVEGLAPIVPLLVAQIEHALDRSPVELRRLTRLVAADGEAGVEVTSPCRVRLTAYRLDRLYRSHAHEVFDGVLEPGRHRIALDAKAVKGESFVVARTAGSVLVEAWHAETPRRRACGGR